VRASHEIALAAQYQARAEASQALALAHIEVGYVPFVPELRRGVENGASAEDINTMHWLWLQMDNHYYQYQAGFLPQDAWDAQLRNTRELFEFCDLRFVYDWRKSGLREEFASLVASFDDPCVDSAS